MKKCLTVIAMCLLCSLSWSATIHWGVSSYIYTSQFEEYGFNSLLVSLVQRTPEPAYYDVILGINTVSAANKATLYAETELYVLDPRHSWRVLKEGDIVNYNAMYGDHNDYFFRLYNGARSDRNLVIGIGQSIYLGYTVGAYFENVGDTPIYGWVELGYDGNSVYVVNSAVDIDGDPIQVGWIPEPSAGILALAACAVLLVRRNKRRA